jgi:hypothetical protein
MGCTDSQTFRLSLRPEVMQPLIGRQQGWRRRDNVVVHEAATGQPIGSISYTKMQQLLTQGSACVMLLGDYAARGILNTNSPSPLKGLFC